MKPAAFSYHAPKSVEEILSLLSEHGDEAKILGGGQSLIPLMALRLATPSVVIDINGVDDLDYVRTDDNTLQIGALARHRDIEELKGLAEWCPMLLEAIQMVGHVAIRNRGTVVGSMAHADPAAEWPAMALGLEGVIDVVGPSGKRTIAADDFFVSLLTTAIEPGEVATEVRLHLPKGRVGSCFLELARRHGDFAVTGVGTQMSLSSDRECVEDARVVAIGVGQTAVRIREAEDVLVGESPIDELYREAARVVHDTIAPSDDIHATADYRRSIAEVLTRRSLAIAAERARGETANG